jgi:hypothetical protein
VGFGIPDNVREKIFDRYHKLATADGAKQKGSGLGLAICKAIVEAHSGSIGVKKAPAKGSIFSRRRQSLRLTQFGKKQLALCAIHLASSECRGIELSNGSHDSRKRAQRTRSDRQKTETQR